MITLETNEKMLTDETLRVFEGGEFENTDLVLIKKEGESVPKYQYQAYFIKYGEIYYD
jgi:hypothetical protein